MRVFTALAPYNHHSNITLFDFNMRTLTLGLAAGLYSSFSAAALQPVSEAPLAVKTAVSCQHNKDNSLDCVTSKQFTILHPSGREQLSRIDFTYPAEDRMQVERAEVIQPNGKVIKLGKSQIETRAAPNPDAGVSRDMQTWMAFPELSVGSTVSYRIKTHSVAQPLVRQLRYQLDLGPQKAREDSFSFDLRSTRPLIWRGMMLDDYAVDASADRKRVKVSLRRPRYLNYINEWNNSALREWPQLVIATSDQPQDHFGAHARRYNEILAAPLPPAAAAVVAANQGKPAAEQTAAFMQHINRNYRYLNDTRLAERGLVPFTLAEIEKHGYGDCKDLSTLLTAMLRRAGIAAEPALIYRGKFAPPLLLPGVGAPNHMIVRADIAGQTWWLDPTNPFFQPGRIMSDLQDRWAFIIGKDGVVSQTQVPMEPARTDLNIKRENALQADGAADVSADIELANSALIDTILQDRYQGISATDQSLCNRLSNQPEGCKVQRDKTSFMVPSVYPLRMSVRDPRMLEKISGLFLYDSHFKGVWDSFDNYKRNGNLADVYLGDASAMQSDVLLKGAKAIQPAFECKVSSPWYEVNAKQQQTPAGIRVQYRISNKVRWLSHAEINSPEFAKLIEDARACVSQVRQIVKL